MYAARAADDVRGLTVSRPPQVAPWYAGEASLPDEAVIVSHTWDEIRRPPATPCSPAATAPWPEAGTAKKRKPRGRKAAGF